MRWTSKLVNPKIVVFPEGLSSRKTTSRGLTTWCSPHIKAITVLLYRNYSKMFKNVEDNTMIVDIENRITEPGWKKNRIFKTLPVVRGYSGLQPIVSVYLHYICLGCSPSCLPRQQDIRKTSKLSYYILLLY
jgi:hypothetical protein